MATTKERFDGALPVGATTDELKNSFTSKNAVTEGGDTKLAADPVKVYWIMYAKTPVREEGLNMIERNTAYGSKTVPDAAKGDGHFVTTLSALPEKKISVSVKDGKLSATTSINGEEMELLHIFVENTTSWGVPKVKHIDIKGRKADGSLSVERKTP